MLGKDDQRKGTDLRENRKTSLPFLRRHFGSRSTVIPSPRGADLSFLKIAAMLQIPRVFPRVSCIGSAKAVQCPRPGPKIGEKGQKIPRYFPVCPRGQPPRDGR